MEWIREMVNKLNQAVNGEKDAIMAEYEALTGKGRAALYRIAKNNGFSGCRNRRVDAGGCAVTKDQMQFVSSLIQSTAREVKGSILPVSEALDIAVDNGIIRTGEISVGRLTTLLREREMNGAALDAPTPSIRMRSLHPNHVHVFDASICIQYYLRNSNKLGFMDERDFREKKPKNFAKIKNRIFRLVLADHFSHYLYVKYYLAAGENMRMTFDFLTSAWRGGHHEKSPFRGVPAIVLMDAGSANVAKGILELLKRLDIKLPENMPHNPRRQGSAEEAQNLIETHFEARLRLEPATTIEEMNAWVTDWLVAWNGKKRHRRHGMARTACWLKYIREEHIRDLPADDMLQDLFAEPEVTRTVAQDNTISFRAQTYRLKHIEGIRPRQQVKVILRPYHWPEVGVVFNDTEYPVSPTLTVEGGFLADAAVIGEEYKAQPETAAMKERKVNDNLAYGDERRKDSIPYGGTLQVFGHHAEKVKSAPMPRRGTPINVGLDTQKAIPIMEFMKKVINLLGKVRPSENALIRETYGTSIMLTESERVMGALMDGITLEDALKGGVDVSTQAVVGG